MAAVTCFDSWILAVVQEVAIRVHMSVRGCSGDVVDRSHILLRYIEECLSPVYCRIWRVNVLPCSRCIDQLNVDDLGEEVVFLVDERNVTQVAEDQSRLFGTLKEYCISSLCVHCQSSMCCGGGKVPRTMSQLRCVALRVGA